MPNSEKVNELHKKLKAQEAELVEDIENLRDEYSGTVKEHSTYPMYTFDVCAKIALQKIHEAYFWLNRGIGK